MAPHDLHHPLADVLEGTVGHVLDDLAAQVRGHDQDRVPEVDSAALTVGQAAVVEQLEQDVEHVRVRLLDLVQEDDRVRPPADRLGELATLLVAHVARRRADQPGHGVALLVFRHVETGQGLLVVEEELGQRPCQLRLPHPRGPEEDEGPDRPVGVREPGPRAAHRAGDRVDRLVLAHHPPVQAVLHLDELLGFALEEPVDRDARPARHDGGDVVLVDLLLDHRVHGLQLAETLAGLVELSLELDDLAVSQAGGLLEVGGTLGALGLLADLLQLLLQRTHAVDQGLLLLPARTQRGALLAELRELPLQGLEPLPGAGVLLLHQRLALDL